MEKYTDVGRALEYAWTRSAYRYIEEDRSDRMHVTDLVYNCERRIYYMKRYPEIYRARYDPPSILTLALGKKLHEIPIAPVDMSGYQGVPREELERARERVAEVLSEWDGESFTGFHELPVAWYPEDGGDPVTGRLDELVYLPGTGWVLVDKKTTAGSTPRQPYEHHVTQVSLYAFLVEENYGLRPDKLAILYIDHAEKRLTAFEMDNNVNPLYAKTLLHRAQRIWDHVKRRVPPPAMPGWECKYCPFHALCYRDAP